MKANANSPLDKCLEEPRKTVLVARRSTNPIASSMPIWQQIPCHVLGSTSGVASMRLYSTASSNFRVEPPVGEIKEKVVSSVSEKQIAASQSSVDRLNDEAPAPAINTEETTATRFHIRKIPLKEDASAVDRTIGIGEESQEKTRAIRASEVSEPSEIQKMLRPPYSSRQAYELFSQKFVHLNQRSEARMVPVHNKNVTSRTAVALCRVTFSNDRIATAIVSNLVRKGDVLGVARVAGIMAAKKCSDVIPLCHPIMLSLVQLDLKVHDTQRVYESSIFNPSPSPHDFQERKKNERNEKANFGWVSIRATVSCDGKTGVEMEALTAASVAALTVYDMCKGIDKGMKIEGLRIVKKTGGESGTWLDGKKQDTTAGTHGTEKDGQSPNSHSVTE